MQRFKIGCWGWMVCGLIGTLASPMAHSAEPDQAELRKAITKGMALIEASTKEYLEQRACFSCHHQAMPMVMLSEAKKRGFEIDEENFQAQLQRTLNHLEGGKKNYEQGKGQGGRVDTAAWGLWALESGGHKPDDTTAAVAHFLLTYQKDRGHWTPPGNRPPTGASWYASTYVALRGLEHYSTPEQQKEFVARLQRIPSQLENGLLEDTENRVYNLRIWHYIKSYEAGGPAIAESTKRGVGPNGETLRAYGYDFAGKGWGDRYFNYFGSLTDYIKVLAEDLLKRQNEDGGWSQTEELESDAYATGTALVALNETGQLPVTDPRYQKGLQFLLSTQLPDGSWKVQTRSRPFQTYFESGFPHKKSQFVSIAGSSWAVTAMLKASPKVAVAQKQ